MFGIVLSPEQWKQQVYLKSLSFSVAYIYVSVHYGILISLLLFIYMYLFMTYNELKL